MTEHTPAPENKRHYPGLDGLRALAVLAVFAQHYFAYPNEYKWGWVGVQVFFVLSGFLITGILYDTRNAPNRYRVFYARRALRIFPLYFGVLAVGWSLWPVFHWELHRAWLLAPLYLSNYSRFLWFADFLQGHALEHLRATPHPPRWFWLLYGHFWSLAVEEQFYLVWPFAVFTLRERKRLLLVCAAAVCLTPLCRVLCVLTLPRELLRAEFVVRVTPLQLDSLLLGAALALYLHGNPKKLTGLARAVLGLAALALVLFLAFYVRTHHRMYAADWTNPVFASVGLSAINVVSAALLLLAIDATTWWSGFLNLPWLRSLGKISYGFYVFHDIPHMLYLALGMMLIPLVPVYHADPHRILVGVMAFAGTLLLAAFSFRFFEMPFLRLKSRFIAE